MDETKAVFTADENIDRELFLELIRYVRLGIAPGIEYRNDIYLIELDTKLDILSRLIQRLSFIHDATVLKSVFEKERADYAEQP